MTVINRLPTARESLEVLRRILEGSIVRSPSGCWEWTGKLTNGGYGLFSWAGRQYRAHRVAYEVYRSSIPDDLLVMHECDNPRCCNPDHLEIGTTADNNREARERGLTRPRSKTHRLPDHQFVTTGEAASIANVSSQTIINWCESGMIPFSRVGKWRRMLRIDFLRYLESNNYPLTEFWKKVLKDLEKESRQKKGG